MRHPARNRRFSATHLPQSLALFLLLIASAPSLALDPPSTFLPPAPNPGAAPTPQNAPPPSPPPAAEKPATPAPTGPSANDAILELQSAYRNAPICERIQVEVHYPAPAPAIGTRIARSSVSVHLSGPAETAPDTKPGSTEAPAPQDQIIALELGALRIYAARGRLTAIHSRDPATYFQAAIDDQPTSRSLAAALPPILIPELDLKTAPADAPCSAFWPYATDITWQSVEVDPKHPSKRTIRGTCTEGTLSLTTLNQRLRTLTIDLPAKQTSLVLNFSTFGPCDPARLAIDTTRRQRVDAMDELRPHSGTLRIGVRVPYMPITQGLGGQAGTGWDLGALLQPPAKAQLAGATPAEHVILIFLRDPPLPSAADETKEKRFDPEALARILRSLRTEAFAAHAPAPTTQPPDTESKSADKDPALHIARFGFAPVFVMAKPNPDDLLARLKAAGPDWPAVLWTTEAKSTIDLFAPTSDAAAIILDSEFVLRAVVPIDPSQTAEQIGDQLAASLFELGAGDSK
jgi:hypothetical protein